MKIIISKESLAAAIKYAEVCDWAYLDHASLREKVGASECFLFEDIETDTQAYVICRKNEIIVAFRGTEPSKAKDFVTDARFKLIAHSMGTVHEGFSQALSAVRTALLEKVFELHTDQRVIIVGHSLGGALAMLLAADIKKEIAASHVDVYTFGQPRVGCPKFISAYEQYVPRYHRFVNDKDVVPKVPTNLWLGYRHSTNFFHIGSDFTITPQKEGYQWIDNLKTLLVGLFENVKDWTRLKSFLEAFAKEQVNDHSMAVYISALKHGLALFEKAEEQAETRAVAPSIDGAETREQN